MPISPACVTHVVRSQQLALSSTDEFMLQLMAAGSVVRCAPDLVEPGARTALRRIAIGYSGSGPSSAMLRRAQAASTRAKSGAAGRQLSALGRGTGLATSARKSRTARRQLRALARHKSLIEGRKSQRSVR